MRRWAAGTIVAKNCLPLARVLAHSFHRFHPDIPFFVLLADTVDGRFEPGREPFHLLPLEHLSVARIERLTFGYTRQELSYSLTPHLLVHLLDCGFDRIIFLKQESLVLGSLEPEFARLETDSILLTPHLLTPLTGAGSVQRELAILQAGMYNGGFLGVSATPSARGFLDWWKDRLVDGCIHAITEGMHFEQRWLDLVPVFFEGTSVLRDPGINVGHWNLPERRVCAQGDAVVADGAPCRFFRFSGFDPRNPQFVTRYSPRLTMATAGRAAEVFERYLALLNQAGYEECSTWPYAYACFDNGEPIPDVAREIYRELGDEAARFGDAARTGSPHSFFHWLNEPAPVTRFWQGVYRRRPDVRAAYPDLDGPDRDRFVDWTVRSGAHEHGVPACFLTASA